MYFQDKSMKRCMHTQTLCFEHKAPYYHNRLGIEQATINNSYFLTDDISDVTSYKHSAIIIIIKHGEFSLHINLHKNN